jgi:hypothetical protein
MSRDLRLEKYSTSRNQLNSQRLRMILAFHFKEKHLYFLVANISYSRRSLNAIFR